MLLGPPDSLVEDTLHVSVEAGYEVAPPSTEGAAIALRTLASSLTLPVPLPTPAILGESRAPRGFSSTVAGSPGYASPSISAEVMVRLKRDGAVASIVLTQTSLVPSIDSALLAVVTSGAAEGTLGAFQQGAKHGGAVFVSLHTSPPSPVVGQTTSRQISTIPITSIRMPRYRLSSELRPATGNRAPTFPSSMRARGVSGHVDFEVVVGVDGRILPGTMRLVGNPYRDFASRAMAALGKFRFEPAHVDGCPVAQRARQRFQFEMEQRP